MKRERDPTPEEFAKLVAWLASAGREYETMHDRLTRIFITRGCNDAETLADEVMNRVAVRIEKVIKTYQGDPFRCLQGFAEKVYLEDLPDQRRRTGIDPSVQPISSDHESDQEKREQEDECLTRCMGELTPPERDLFRRYFHEEKRAKIDDRKKLAAELGVTANALRIKAHRIRRPLRKCMELCLEVVRDR